MTIESCFQRTEDNLDRLTNVVGTLAASVAAHDSQILKDRFDARTREWQAYLHTIHARD